MYLAALSLIFVVAIRKCYFCCFDWVVVFVDIVSFENIAIVVYVNVDFVFAVYFQRSGYKLEEEQFDGAVVFVDTFDDLIAEVDSLIQNHDRRSFFIALAQ